MRPFYVYIYFCLDVIYFQKVYLSVYWIGYRYLAVLPSAAVPLCLGVLLAALSYFFMERAEWATIRWVVVA